LERANRDGKERGFDRLCDGYRETVPVHEAFKGQTLRQGNVEVFDLNGHPKAKKWYGWTHGVRIDAASEEDEKQSNAPPFNMALVRPERAA
jgi:hypothetical protein